MKTKTILERYARYYDYLQKLGEYPLDSTPTIEVLGLPKALIQSGYKEMKEIRFKGNLIDYLCFVSMIYVMDLIKKRLPNCTDIKVYTMAVVDSYESYKADVTNFLRIFQKDPDLFTDTLVDVCQFGWENSLPAITFLTAFWFVLLKKDSSTPEIFDLMMGMIKKDILVDKIFSGQFMPELDDLI